MKQRVIVQAIIRNNDTTLLLRRSQGRPSMIGSFELPGGKLETEEQPDQSIRRHVANDTGLTIVNMRLIDSVALLNNEETNAQNVLLVYDVVVGNPEQAITLGRSYDDSIWQPLSQLQRLKLRDSTKLVLEVVNNHHIPELEVNEEVIYDVNDTSNSDKVIIYSDGGSRGNPGPSSAGFVIMNKKEEVLDKGGEYLGITTNNQAEYQGVRIGLEHARAMGAKIVEFRLDSMLVVNQMKGIYKIKNRELWPINERIKGLITQFDKVTFIHVPRELNQIADAMVNSALDKHKAATI
jgi:ribonuclease HI/ADP-ribose pyrophosphatase YjhB (NUDIX family)